MSSPSNLFENTSQYDNQYEDAKRQAIEGVYSSTMQVIPLNRKVGAFFPFLVCHCVWDAPDSPCHCAGPILWIDENDILDTGKAGRNSHDGKEVYWARIKAGARLIEETHNVIMVEDIQKSIGTGGSGLSPNLAQWRTDDGTPSPTSYQRETLDSLRQPVIRAIRDAAKANRVSVNADALAVSSQPGLLFVNAPVTGVEKIDFRALFDGRPVSNDIPVMYWHLSGDRLCHEKSPISAGFYTVIAHVRRRRVSLRDAEGKTIAEGDLDIGIEPSTPGTAEAHVSGGITDFKVGKHSVKLCGKVDIEVGPATVKIDGCIEVSW